MNIWGVKVARDEKNGATRRDFLYIWTGALGAVTAGSVVTPLIKQMSPDASTLAAGAPINIDLSQISEGQVVTVKWRGKPVFIRHRSQEEITFSQAVDLATLKDPQTDLQRVRALENVPQLTWIVVYGICTHLGCVPNNAPSDLYRGWYCPCHGSHYDNAGRVRQGPAPRNLDVPPYAFLSETLLRLG